MMPSAFYGEVGVWVGCGFDTIPIILPPPSILGYDACVPPILWTSGEGLGVATFQGPPI